MTGIKKLLENNTSPIEMADLLASFLNYKEAKRKVMFYHDVVIKNYINKIHSYEYQIVSLIEGHRNNIDL